ncbi:MAG: radical SAM protein [Proteobacteria bacterium]|nr:radical SAM protein [Pseudomonadota bacterium]
MKFIFGPVASRRLKRSLGIDLIPYKTCSFDCIYCELGRTTNLTMDREEYVPHKEIITNVKKYLKAATNPPDYITLGGSGEPTLHSKIGAIISEIKKITSIPVAVLTNGSTLYQDEVKEELLNADVILPSLDAVRAVTFKQVNHPHPSLDIKKIIQGLKELRESFQGQIWLEILFCLGVNDDKEEIKLLQKAVREIDPDKIQLNTVDRPPPQGFVCPLKKESLENIKKKLGDKAEIISRASAEGTEEVVANAKKRVFDLLRRRPCPLDDISRALGINRNELAKLIDILSKEGKIHCQLFNNQYYYQVNESEKK